MTISNVKLTDIDSVLHFVQTLEKSDIHGNIIYDGQEMNATTFLGVVSLQPFDHSSKLKVENSDISWEYVCSVLRPFIKDNDQEKKR